MVVGYVVMPEHFHLLISEPEKGNPSTVIQALKLGIVRQLFPTSPKNGEKWGTQGVFNDLPPKSSGSGVSTTLTSGQHTRGSRS